jgi:Ni,Fe-hydrogenase I large subunit
MMFDVVAAAAFYPEYFWIGNAYERFLAYGVFEKGDTANPLGDKRLLSRGRKNTGAKYSAFTPPAKPAEWQSVLQQNVLENIENSHYLYNGGKGGWLQPLSGETTPEPRRIPNPQPGDPAYPDKGAYSWVKSPRYKDASDPDYAPAVPYEVGPLARMMVNGDYYAGVLYDLGAMGISAAIPFTDGTKIPVGPFAGVQLPRYGDPGPSAATMSALFPGMGTMPDLSGITYNGDSCLDRYAARQIEAWKVANAMVGWLNTLASNIGAVTSISRSPANGDKYYSSSYGWTEAPRGALGHWMKTDMGTGKIQNYQCVVPSTWNASPRDSFGTPGPAEKSMENIHIKDINNPLELLRNMHSWDFCSACSIHLVQKKGRGKTEEKTIRIDPAPTGG